MAQAAGAGSDIVLVTSDNPRSEDPEQILGQVVVGLQDCDVQYETLVDRRTAITKAIRLAKEGDCILIAGKGHEDYQIFADRTIHFDDREVAREALAGLGY
jgi:UDP-N-acetylmuramoyl-L-alanyl-D-glutamate--2,6-diaminopimelate ligase